MTGPGPRVGSYEYRAESTGRAPLRQPRRGSSATTARPLVEVRGVGRQASARYCATCGQKRTACHCGSTA